MKIVGSGPQGFSHIAQQLLNQPVAIHPHKMEVLLCALQQKLGIVSLDTIDGVTLDAREMLNRSALAADSVKERNNTFHNDGPIAVIPVHGTLVHKFGWLDPVSGMTGYDGISRKIRDASRDPDIFGIWLDIDSPGGSVSGLFALAEEIAMASKASGGKPIYAYVNEQACSAAYAIASVCDKVYGPQDAITGSIGCVMVHTSIADALEDNGVKVTVIRSGDRKMKGNPYENLDEEALDKFQKSVDGVRTRFANLVSMGREITVTDALGTEADWFEGTEAVQLGLMDDILSERDAWSRLEEEVDTIKRMNRSN